jgi:hypothetical protein
MTARRMLGRSSISFEPAPDPTARGTRPSGTRNSARSPFRSAAPVGVINSPGAVRAARGQGTSDGAGEGGHAAEEVEHCRRGHWHDPMLAPDSAGGVRERGRVNALHVEQMQRQNHAYRVHDAIHRPHLPPSCVGGWRHLVEVDFRHSAPVSGRLCLGKCLEHLPRPHTPTGPRTAIDCSFTLPGKSDSLIKTSIARNFRCSAP